MIILFNIWYDPDYHNKIGIDGGLAVADKGQLNCLCLTDGTSYKIPYKDGQPGELQRIIKDLSKTEGNSLPFIRLSK